MPASVASPGALGAKLVTVFGSNEARGLPTHLASIVLLDPDTGALRALLYGRYITESRTAAVSAVSARHLALPTAANLAILGSGVQARSHLLALPRVLDLAHARIWSPNAAHRQQFVEAMTTQASLRLDSTADAETAVRDADVVVLATASDQPVIRSEWVKAGAHVISVGACRPHQREMDPRLVARARLFVDSRAAALVESGDVVMGMAEGRFGTDHLAGELGEVVARRVPGRTSADEVTIFKSLGMAVEDVVAAELALRRAIERGIGRELEL